MDAIAFHVDRPADEKRQTLVGVIGDESVVGLSFYENDDYQSPFTEIENVKTGASHRRRGYATAALREIVERAGGLPVVNGSDAHTNEEGKSLLESARASGIPIHRSGCFRGGRGCGCGELANGDQPHDE